ncbi:MAG: hypothetical protein BGO16_12165 [Nitrobacter sp. 62-23]|nr:MAG: hypothetical protein BGO16_12165 [Nitrobacter sp. 62-23]
MIFVLTFIILLIFIFVGAYFLLDDFDPEGMLFPAFLISAGGGGAVTFALSDADRLLIIGSIFFLTACIVLAIFWCNRRSRRRSTRQDR